MKNSRGKVYIDSTVQGALVKRVIAHWFVFFALAMVCLYAMEMFFGPSDASFSDRVGAIWANYSFFILLMAAIVPAFAYDTVKMSHRFVGPVHRVKAVMKQLADGEDVGEIQLRGSDFWRELAPELNRIAQRLKSSAS